MANQRPPRDAYRDAGVDIAAGEAVVEGIREAVRSTWRPGVLGDLGGFGGLFALDGRWRDPVLVSGTDGVGTKLLVAARMGRHDTIGIDLVAMCVNDVVTCGAEPLFFLDYFATGRLDPQVAVEVVRGIAAGCREAGCALVGGETAEMPGMYAAGHYDLAGFAVGVVERDAILDGRDVRAGDLLVGWPSTGLHSNGYSLARKLLDPLDWSEPHGLDRPLGEALLAPTRIYVGQVLSVRDRVKALAHITGGGLLLNLPRVLPAGLGAFIDRSTWRPPPLFDLLVDRGGLTLQEAFRTFNMGIGMVAVAAPEQAGGLGGVVIGEVRPGEGVTLS